MNGLWPYHPKPLPDELLSSWIIRTAFGNAEKLQTFSHLVWPGRQIWTRDIDTLAPSEIIFTMAKMTNTDLSLANNTTFRNYEGILFERINIKGPTHFINRIGVYHRTRRLPGLQWCVRCLSEDKKPYYRKLWRLSFVSTCLKHGILLDCVCRSCGTPANPHRSREHACHKCGLSRLGGPELPAEARVLQLQGSLTESSYGRAHNITAFSNLHPYVFFLTIRRLNRLLSSGQRSERLRASIEHHHRLFPSVMPENKKLRIPEQMMSSERHRMMLLCSYLLDGWPWMFIAFCQEARISWTWITKDYDLKDIPYHLIKITNEFLSPPVALRKAMTRGT